MSPEALRRHTKIYWVSGSGTWGLKICNLEITRMELLVMPCCSSNGIWSFISERVRAPDVFRSTFENPRFVSVVAPDTHQGGLAIQYL